LQTWFTAWELIRGGLLWSPNRLAEDTGTSSQPFCPLSIIIHALKQLSRNIMYGMVNKAVEEMVLAHHGESVWEQIKSRAGVDVDVFMSNESYPDEITYNLVAAASELLKVPSEEVLVAFGEHWILHTAVKGYGGLILAAGKTMPEFLHNLPNFHSRVAMIYPNLQPPRFECTDITESQLRLHYYSHREGLAAFVVGLMQGLGKLFGTPATVSLAEAKSLGAHHDVFTVSWSNPSKS